MAFHWVIICRKCLEVYVELHWSQGTFAEFDLYCSQYLQKQASRYSPMGAMKNLKVDSTFRMKSRWTVEESVVLFCWNLVNKRNSTEMS